MKANRKFLRDNDAVSPVIAVILMVAITVVLAATVYVWVSGFSGGHNQAARAVTASSNGPLLNGMKNFTITASDASLFYRDVTFTLDGQPLALTGTCNDVSATTLSACRGTDALEASDQIRAGDRIMIAGTAGQTLRIIDAQANSILMTMVIG